MTTTIFKYPVPIQDQPVIPLPVDAKILSVAEQDDLIYLWALVDTEAEFERRPFSLRGTGHPADGLENVPFIGTIHYGSLVFHLWDGVPE